jgi:hypothetical protein
VVGRWSGGRVELSGGKSVGLEKGADGGRQSVARRTQASQASQEVMGGRRRGGGDFRKWREGGWVAPVTGQPGMSRPPWCTGSGAVREPRAGGWWMVPRVCGVLGCCWLDWARELKSAGKR